MSSDDRLRAVDADLDARLRRAAGALREGSGTQVDAALGLREILHAPRAMGDPPEDPAAPLRRSPRSALLRRSQRLALAVNLLLVLVLGGLVVQVADRRDAVHELRSTPVTATTTVTTTPPAVSTTVKVPRACLDAQELADEVITRPDRNQRDQRLFAALRDFTIARQACRRAAASP